MRVQLRGDAFPSVRVLSQELKINPNTAFKIVGVLKREGILEIVPGIGTIVSDRTHEHSKVIAIERAAGGFDLETEGGLAVRAGVLINVVSPEDACDTLRSVTAPA